MKKGYDFKSSNEIVELKLLYGAQAENLVIKIREENNQNFFIQIDCAPNGQLNSFNYGNGLEAVKIIKKLAGSFLAKDLFWLEQKIELLKNSSFKTNFDLGAKIGLWEKVKPNDYQKKIDWNKPFCVKNENNSTKIWHPDSRFFGHNVGFSTKGSIVNFIHENTAYLQDFYMPLPGPNGSSAWKTTYRLVFLCEANQRDPEFIGGLWISRSGFKIYPGKDSLVGLISPKKVD